MLTIHRRGALRSTDVECVICTDDRVNKCVYVLSTLTYFWFNRWELICVGSLFIFSFYFYLLWLLSFSLFCINTLSCLSTSFLVVLFIRFLLSLQLFCLFFSQNFSSVCFYFCTVFFTTNTTISVTFLCVQLYSCVSLKCLAFAVVFDWTEQIRVFEIQG